MPTPTWPSYAKLSFEGFGQTTGKAVTRTDMEDGPPKQVKQKSRVLITQAATVLLTSKTDLINFKTWHRVDISYGALWFNRTDPVDGATKLSRIVGGSMQQEKPSSPLLEQWHIPMQIEFWDS